MNAQGNLQMPSFEDDRDVRKYLFNIYGERGYRLIDPIASVDEHLQGVGAEVFNKLQRSVVI